jgi:hypothetical protein
MCASNSRESTTAICLARYPIDQNLPGTTEHACNVLRCLPRHVRMRAKALKVRVNHRWLVEIMHPRHTHCFTGRDADIVLTGILVLYRLMSNFPISLDCYSRLRDLHIQVTCDLGLNTRLLIMALEILGAVAAGVALCTTLVESGKAIRKATKRIRNARKDVLELSDEAVIFAGLCEDFLHTCNDHREAKSRVFGSLHRLVAWLDHFKNALSELLNKVKAIIRDPRYHYSWEKKCSAYLEWMGSKSTVKKLRASLELAISSISGYSNLMYIQRLHEELQMLKLALENERSRQTIEEKFGMTLEEKIEMVLQSM